MIDGPPEPGRIEIFLVCQEHRRSAVASSGSPEKHRWSEAEDEGARSEGERRGVEMRTQDKRLK